MFVGYCAPKEHEQDRQTESNKHPAPTALTFSLPRGRQRLWNTENLAPHLFTIYDSLFTALMIGFDRSALVANPASGTGNQNVDRVVTVRFMTKVFRSILSKNSDPEDRVIRRNNYEAG
jgi:hypothetical protein